MKIGPLVQKLLQIFDFQDGGGRHIGFHKKVKFWNGASFCFTEATLSSNFMKIGRLVQKLL